MDTVFHFHIPTTMDSHAIRWITLPCTAVALWTNLVDPHDWTSSIRAGLFRSSYVIISSFVLLFVCIPFIFVYGGLTDVSLSEGIIRAAPSPVQATRVVYSVYPL